MTEHAPDRTPGRPAARTVAGQEGTPAPEERTRTDRVAESATPTRSPEDRLEGEPDAAELEDRWLRAVADLDNLRKRYARELGREREAERELVASAFLPVLDTIDRALQHAESDPRSIIEGIRTLREQALAVLAGLGYSREDEIGVPFDPARHEVVGVVEPDEGGTAPGSVAQVVRPGYGGPSRQLRPASVTVAQSPGD
ncbi:nucleotide exchange factor GrpE [Pseudonocardia sp. CA-142604]|uniref:nucleotide exchange factor GrpE n=1 Tax=Pseudonocardia sp. CA-142604 TaxID=3240024 RepID=UPI003D939B01